jgi:hypothetical protein
MKTQASLRHLAQGLPDGIFSNHKSQFGQILEGVSIEEGGMFYCHLVYFTAIWPILLPFGLFYCHLVYFTAIWQILCPFGIFHGCLVYFSRFGMLFQEKSGNPDLACAQTCAIVFKIPNFG